MDTARLSMDPSLSDPGMDGQLVVVLACAGAMPIMVVVVVVIVLLIKRWRGQDTGRGGRGEAGHGGNRKREVARKARSLQ